MSNGTGRKTKDWLTTYLEYNSQQESPQMFHLWVGLSVIASALSRGVFFERGYYTLHPNLYVVLVGASAKVRKSTAVNTGFNIYKTAFGEERILLSQKVTPEALIGTLAKRGLATGISDAVMVSTELSVFLGNSGKDDSLIQLLTKLYDCESTLDYHTIIRGKEVCPNVCFNLMGATTPEWIKTAMPTHAVGGGFTSRIIFVFQSEPEKKVAFPSLSPEQKHMRELLVEDLRIIGKLQGEYHLTQEARDWYTEWYGLANTERTEASLDGYYGRKHDTLLKLGIIIAASRHNRLVIDDEDLIVALKALNENEKYLPEIMKNVLANVQGEERGKVYRAIQRRGTISYTDILRGLSYCMDAKRLQELLDTLLQEGAIIEDITDTKRFYKIK